MAGSSPWATGPRFGVSLGLLVQQQATTSFHRNSDREERDFRSYVAKGLLIPFLHSVANHDLSSDVTMATLAGGIQALTTSVQSIRSKLSAMQNRESTMRAELTALQNPEGIQNLYTWMSEDGNLLTDRSKGHRAHTTPRFSISRTFLEKIFWLGAPSSKSLQIIIGGPMKKQNSSCMLT